MKQRSMMSRRKMNTRRKVIIYVVVMILILGIVSGFTDPFISDNTIYTAKFGETIVIEAETPTSGSPADHDLISNLKYAAYKIHHSSFFRGTTDGTAVADLGITTYTQNIHNTRVVKGENIVFAEAISSSSMKSVAEQKYADNGIIIYRPSTSINGSSAKFSGSAYAMKYEDFTKKYGSIPNQLSKYIINEETIIGVSDDYAKSKKASNSDGQAGSEESAGGFDFYVPENLTQGEDGNYRFTLKLDPVASTLYYRNEIRTMAGADDNPVFSAVSITVTIDEHWNPVSTRVVEVYDIAIPVIGAMTCTGRLTEVFTDIDKEDGEVPEQAFFQPYVDQARLDPTYTPEIPENPNTSPADYLAAAFGDYLSGEKDLDLVADVKYGDFGAYDLTLSVNIGTLDIKAMLDDLFIGYSSKDNKVNIKLNDINGYMSLQDFSKLADDENIAALISRFGTDGFDVTALFGGDMLGTVFKDCEMTTADGVTRIHMPFALDTSSLGIGLDKIDVDASIYVKDDGKVLQEITGDITIAGRTISVCATPLKKSPKFPSTDGAVDMSDIAEFVPALLSTAMQETYGITGTINAMGQEIGVTAYVDRRDGLKADATLSVFGQDVYVKYVNDIIYLGLGNIDVRGTADELPALLRTVSEYSDIAALLENIKKFLPESVNDMLQMVKSAEVTGTQIKLGMNVLFAPINVTLTAADGKLSDIDFDMAFDKFGIKLDVQASLHVSEPTAREVVVPTDDEYITFTQLNTLLGELDKYITHNCGYNIAVTGSTTVGQTAYPVSGIVDIDRTPDGENTVVTAAGKLDMLGQSISVTYAGDTAYVRLGNVKIRLAASEVDKLQTPATDVINSIIDIVGGSQDQSYNELITKALGTIETLYVDDNGNLVAVVAIGADKVTLTVNATAGKVVAKGSIRGADINITATVTPVDENRNITPPVDADDYVNAAAMESTLALMNEVLTSRAATADLNVTLGDTEYAATLAASFSDVLRLRLSVPQFALSATDGDLLPLEITVIDRTAYIALGNIKVCGSTDDLQSLATALGSLDSKELNDALALVTNIMNGNLAALPLPDLSTVDLNDVVSNALSALTSLTEDAVNHTITAVLDINGTEITVIFDTLTTDITVSATLTVKAADGTEEQYPLTVSATNITATDPTVAHGAYMIDVDATEYVAAADMIPAVSAVLPLANNTAITLGITGSVYGVQFKDSTVHVQFGKTLDELAIEARLTLGDLPVTVIVKNTTLYMQIGADIKLSEKLTKAAVIEFVTELDNAVPGALKLVQDIIESIEKMTVQKLLCAATVAPVNVTENGITTVVKNNFKAGVDLGANGLDFAATITAANNNGALSALGIALDAFGFNVSLSFDAALNGAGALETLTSTQVAIGGTDMTDSLELAVTLSPATQKEIDVIEGCISLNAAARLITPVLNIVNDAEGVNSITLTLGGSVFIDDDYIPVSGTVIMSVKPFAVSVALSIFDGTENAVALTVKYANDDVYVACGNIMLKLNTDTESPGKKQTGDMARIYNVLARLLPEGDHYLKIELKNLIGLSDGDSVFSGLSLLITRFKNIANVANDAAVTDKAGKIVGMLFEDLGGIDKASAIKTAVNMLKLGENDGEITATVTVMGININLTPHLAQKTNADDSTTTIIETVSIQTGFEKIAVKLDITGYSLKPGVAAVAMPTEEQAAQYVSLAELAETINYAVSTLTTKTPDGDITFELSNFNFDYVTYKTQIECNADGTPKYDEKGNTIPVLDESDRVKPVYVDANENEKLIDKKITVKNKTGESALIGRFEPYTVTNAKGEDETKYTLNLAAHLFIDIQSSPSSTNSGFKSDIGMPITLDFYIAPDPNDNSKTLAFVDYMELDANGNASSGERITIDYDSAMELVAAVMNIMGVDPNTVDLLLGDYNQPIDKTVFKSMDIRGLADVRTMLNGIADAIVYGKNALAKISEAWDIITVESETTEDLRDNFDNDSIQDALVAALEEIKLAIAAFGGNDAATENTEQPTAPAAPTEPTEPTSAVINGKLFHDVVTGITLKKSGDVISADIDNAKTVQTVGTATVSATQGKASESSDDIVIKNITVGGLDVNTALVGNFNMDFSAGNEVTIAIPSNYDTAKTSGNNTVAPYSDFGQIKHLLFDVMNTANMMEFEIGDIDKVTKNYNNIDNQIGMKIVTGVYNIEIVLNYSIKVKIFDKGEKANPRYKTAAVVELQMDTTKGKAIGFIPAGIILPACTTRLYFYDNVLYVHGVKSWKESVGSVKNLTYTDVMYTLDDISNKMDEENGVKTFMNEFVYYLIPFSSTIQSVINSALDIQFSDENRTFAKVFKSYKYDGGNHEAVIGLEELTGVSVFNDVTLNITGMNDSTNGNTDDDNLLDNYVSHLNVQTNIVGSMVKLDVDGNLENVFQYTENGVDKIKSKGLSTTTEGYTVAYIIDNLLAEVTTDSQGNVISVTNRTGGTKWERIWQTA